MSKFLKSEGGFWPNTNKKTEKHPDVTGKIEISTDQLTMLNNMAADGETLKLSVAGWNRRSKSDGKPYIYISAEVAPEQKEGGQRPSPSAHQTPQSQFEAQGLAPTIANEDIPF
jgi:hypothetical protein